MHFSRLAVYQLSERLADYLWTCIASWPPLARNTVGLQIVRAADSIGANIAEGSGRGSFKDNKRFVKTARGSLYEVQHWLRRAYRRDLLGAEQIKELKEMLDNLAPMLNAYLRSIGTERPKKTPGN